MILQLDFGQLGVFSVDLPGLSEKDRELVRSFLQAEINQPRKSREVIADAFWLALHRSPDANPSDLWHHVVYRDYLALKLGTNPSQSWVRTSGEAFEIVIARSYNPLLEPYGLRLLPLFSKSEKASVLERLGVRDQVGSEKIDLAIEARGRGRGESQGYGVVGAIHAKVSLAERVSDDVPASRILMGEGLISALCTLDVKSFPPPHGNLINAGELGTPEKPSDKRLYVESHGDFSVCVSYNWRTVPSPSRTDSGRLIHVSGVGPHLSEPDPFVEYLRRNC